MSGALVGSLLVGSCLAFRPYGLPGATLNGPPLRAPRVVAVAAAEVQVAGDPKAEKPPVFSSLLKMA